MASSKKPKVRSPKRMDPAATIIDTSKQYPTIDNDKIQLLEKNGRRKLTPDIRRRLANIIGRYSDAYDRQKLPPRRETGNSFEKLKDSIQILKDYCSGDPQNATGMNAVRIRIYTELFRMNKTINIDHLFTDLSLLGIAAEIAQESFEKERISDPGAPNKDSATDNLYRGLGKIFEEVEGKKDGRAKTTFFKAAFDILIPEATRPAQKTHSSIIRRINRILQDDKKYKKS